MSARRERMEITISGGRPWGFSIKGGQESNKPLVISKLEKRGKAERGGLFVGDVIYSINNVLLSGMRNEAIQLVKGSGPKLVIEVERGMLGKNTSGIHQSVPHSGLLHHRDYSNPSPASPHEQPYYEEYTDSSSYNCEHPDARTDDVFHPGHHEQGYKALSVSPSSLNEPSSTPHEVAIHEEPTTPDIFPACVKPDSPNRTGLNMNVVGDSIPQPVVKLRTRKARDKGKLIERPRSWHASKHPDPAFTSEERSMRSPGGGYYQQPLAKPRPRSKGWYESGDLKSTYKGEINGSKDSLISGSSHRSYKSGRLSVSSSRSSGTMSSSRGSLDNLMENNYSSRLENYPQIFVGKERYKESSPSKPLAGIVSQQKNIFEKLSHDSTAAAGAQQYRRGSRDDTRKINRAPDGADRERKSSIHSRESSKSPSYCSGSRRSSFSPTPMTTVVEKEDVRQNSYDRDGSRFSHPATNEHETQPTGGRSSCKTNASDNKHSDIKIVKTNPDPSRGSQNTPEPPQRDKSSIQAVRNHHLRSRYGNSQEELSSRSPPRGHSPHSASHHVGSRSPHPDASHKLTVTRPIETSIDTLASPGRQERVFGVMSVGNSNNIVATSVTVSPKVNEDDDKAGGDSHNKGNKPARYELLKDSKSTKDVKTQSTTPRLDVEHRKSGSAELSDSSASKSKGKYGSIWKTPENHRRARSHDFSSVLQDWETRKSSSSEQPKLSLYKPKNNDNTSVASNSEMKASASTGAPADVQVDNLPSILRSLQNTQHGDRKYKNFEPKTTSDNYEQIWYTEGTRDDRARRISAKSLSPKENNSSSYKNWKSEFKEVDLDDHGDDAYGRQESYCSDIKDMSRKVLRVTSFTRKDLTVSPSAQSFEQKKKQFQSPSQKAQSRVLHGRSRSHGNELEEDIDLLPTRSESKDNSLFTPRKPRPKSAGVIRSGPTNRHAPAHRTTMSPSPDPASYYARKCESLPRHIFPRYGSDSSVSPSLPTKPGAYPHKRTSIDVRPEVSPTSNGPQEGMRKENKTAVLNFFSRKAGRSFDSGELGHYTSSTSIHTSHSDETDKRRSKEDEKSPKNRRAVRSGSSDGLDSSAPEKGSPESDKTPPVSRKPDHVTSVRKLKNFKETRDKFLHGFNRLTTRTKSTSSLLEEEASEKLSRGSPLISADKSASLENLTDSGLDMSRASPTGTIEHISPPVRDRSKSSPNIKPLLGHSESPLNDSYVQPPPRKHVKNHRQRHSNSSSASSATTISTLSSFSSSSSTSMGRFPTLGEEEFERLSPPPESLESHPLAEAQSSSSPSTRTSPPQSDVPVPRVPIDTGTYRVVKRKSTGKLLPEKAEDDIESDASYRSTKEIVVTAPKTKSDSSDLSNILLPQPNMPKPVEVPPEEQEKVNRIIEKVKLSGSSLDPKNHPASAKGLPPPPPPQPLDGACEQLLSKVVQQRLKNDLPPPPSVPTKNFDKNKSALVLYDHKEGAPAEDMPTATPGVCHGGAAKEYEDTGKGLDAPATKKSTKDASGGSYENVHVSASGKAYENVFVPQAPANGAPQPSPTAAETSNEDSKKKTEKTEEVETEKKPKETPLSSPPPEISSEPLLPDISLLTEASSLQEQHPDLTRDIIKGDKALAQVLTTSNKKALDYMAGVLAQPSHDIIEEGMRYRRRKPTLVSSGSPGTNKENLNPSSSNDTSCHDNLPASSTYYKTSASKAKILNLVKEKFAEGEIPIENQETLEDINRKKIELVLSIKEKLADLQSMKGLLDVEMRENECLGKHVHGLTKNVCTPREQDKYNIFVQDVDKIINLLLSLSGRLARVENTIQMLPQDADKQEMEILCEKRKKLTEQHNEAKQLKENIDRRQKTVSEILVGYFDQEQFADYEHYIKMKSALIMEQRELDDKTKLGQEQMQCLYDSLPEEWQINLDNMMEEKVSG